MPGNPTQDPLIIVLGATGTGKSQLALDLATRFNGEIVNGDAMQMYNGLPIITNKITIAERRGIPHHLLGFIGLDEEPWTVGLFKEKASRIIKEIRSRGRLPIVVGGTHYYTQALLWDDTLSISTTRAENEDVALLSGQEILNKYPILEGSTEAMLERLTEIDPVMATRWHPGDRRKIRRSLEIYLMTGKKASDIYAEQATSRTVEEDCGEGLLASEPGRLSSTLLFWVHSEAETLKERLDARVDNMVEAGLLEEVTTMNGLLHKRMSSGMEVDRGRGIWVSIGWKEFEEYLAAVEAKDKSREELRAQLKDAIERTKAATRQYAKRQIRWIRLKLISALVNDHALERLYLLDGTDLTAWASKVSQPAIDVAEKFLAGCELPPPTAMSAAAREILRVSEPDQIVRHECEICKTITTTGDQWQTHLGSRRHRGLLKRGSKQEAKHRSAQNIVSAIETA